MGVGERATHTHLVRKPRLRLHDRYETDCHPQNVEQQPPGIGGPHSHSSHDYLATLLNGHNLSPLGPLPDVLHEYFFMFASSFLHPPSVDYPLASPFWGNRYGIQ